MVFVDRSCGPALTLMESKNMEEANEQAGTESVSKETGLAGSNTTESLSQEDMLSIERAQAKLELAALTARAASSESELAQMQYKNIIMQLFMKYGLSKSDTINRDGTITKNGSE